MTQKRTDKVVAKNTLDQTHKKRRHGCIDDEEIDSYLQSEKEIKLKKMIWELMNKEHLKRRKLPKQPTKVQKQGGGSAQKAIEIAGVGKHVEKKTAVSSKINYAALKEFMNEEESSNLGDARNGESEGESECNEVGDFNGVGDLNGSECNEVGDFNGGNYGDDNYSEDYY